MSTCTVPKGATTSTIREMSKRRVRKWNQGNQAILLDNYMQAYKRRFVQAPQIKRESDKVRSRAAELISAKEFKRAAQLHDSHGVVQDDKEAFWALVSLHPPRKDLPADEPSIPANGGAITSDNL